MRSQALNTAGRPRLRRLCGFAAGASVLTTTLLGVAVTSASQAEAVGTTLYIPNFTANTVSVVDASTNTITATIPVGSHPTATAPTPDGSQVLVSNQSSASVSVISTATNSVVATVPVATIPTGILIAPSGTTAYVASAGDGGVISTIDLATDTVTGTVTVGIGGPSYMVLNGTTLYVEKQNGSTIAVDTTTNTVTATINVQASQNYGFAITPDGSKIYEASAYSFGSGFQAAIEVIDTATNTVSAVIPMGLPGSFMGGLAISLDGGTAYATRNTANSVAKISTVSNTVTTTVTGFNAPWGIVLSPSGDTAYVGNVGDGTVSVLDTTTNTITASISGFSAPYYLSQSTTYYPWSGFNSPVADTPAVNQVNAGQGIPLKFSLGSDQGLNIFKPGYPVVKQIDCATGVPINTGTIADTAGESGLQYDATSDTYTYVWKTLKSYKHTCQQFVLGLNDGSDHAANFQFN